MVCQARACSEHSELVIVGVRIPQVPIAAVLVKAIVLCSSLPSHHCEPFLSYTFVVQHRLE